MMTNSIKYSSLWKWTRRSIAVIVVILYALTYTSAQNGQTEPVVLPEVDSTATDSIYSNGFFELFKGKPGRAALYSLLIPSGGQIYNRRWWKVPLALGIETTTTYFVITTSKSLKKSQANYEAALAIKDPNTARYLAIRNNDRKNKEWSYFWLIAGHFLTVLDAYVDRHLMGFDVSDDIFSFSESPPYVPLISIHVPLNKKKKPIPLPVYP